MSTLKQKKVETLIKKELSTILNMERLVAGKMLTVSIVRISPDLQQAKIYLSIFPSTSTDEDIEIVRENKPKLRLLLGNKIKMQVRVIPNLSFYIDDSLDYIENIDALLRD